MSMSFQQSSLKVGWEEIGFLGRLMTTKTKNREKMIQLERPEWQIELLDLHEGNKWERKREWNREKERKTKVTDINEHAIKRIDTHWNNQR